MTVGAETTDRWTEFRREAHFLLEARKKSLFTRPWFHFLEVLHIGWFSARCSLFRWPLDPQAPRPAFEDMAVMEETVSMIPTACGDSDPRRLRTKRFTVS